MKRNSFGPPLLRMARRLAAATFAALLVIGPTAGPAPARGPELTLSQIRSKATRGAALNLHRRVQAMRVSPGQMRIYQRDALQFRRVLRRQVGTQTAEQAWAALIEPINFCTDLVRKVCGAEKQCGDSQQCSIAVQFLELFNAETDPDEKHELEGTCVITLEDNVVFPLCQ